MKKRLLALTLSLALAISVATPALADDVSQIIGDGNTVVFADVPSNYWAVNEITYFAAQGIIDGKPDGSFAPTEGVTREQFAKMMVLTFRAAPQSPELASFTDVSTNKWSYPYIEASKDFLTGYVSPFDGSMTFHPEEFATREDIAVALVRMMGLTDKDVQNINYAKQMFSDSASISPSLLPYVSLAAERGLITGFPDGTFGPTKQISRAEAVVLLNRASKQAVTGAEADIQAETNIIYSDDGTEAYLLVWTEEGVTVEVDGKKLTMESADVYGYPGEYVGEYDYLFETEGTKTFSITVTKLGKKKTLEETATYKIGVPSLSINPIPEKVAVKTTLTIPSQKSI